MYDMESGTFDWRKARASAPSGCCVELAPLPDGGVVVRDSKDQDGPMLRFTRDEWVAFADGMAAGEFASLIANRNW